MSLGFSNVDLPIDAKIFIAQGDGMEPGSEDTEVSKKLSGWPEGWAAHSRGV